MTDICIYVSELGQVMDWRLSGVKLLPEQKLCILLSIRPSATNFTKSLIKIPNVSLYQMQLGILRLQNTHILRFFVLKWQYRAILSVTSSSQKVGKIRKMP